MEDLECKAEQRPSKLTPGQRRAIISSIDLGKILQQEHPEIADLYRKGNGQEEIVRLKEFHKEYDKSIPIARGGVQRALAGHKKGFEREPYEGLIPKEERDELEEEQRQKGRKKGQIKCGEIARDEGKGIFSLSFEERRELMRENGYKTLRERKGVHGLNHEERLSVSRQGTLARGDIPWTRVGDIMPDDSVCEISEAEYAYILSLRPKYQNNFKGDNIKISEELNRIYQNNRTPKKVGYRLYKFRKSLEQNLED